MEGVSVSEKMTREKFEELNDDLLKGALRYVKAALEDAGLDKSAIDELVLVGGSTRIPKIRRLIKEFFNGKTPHKGINVDESVAYGAAVHGVSIQVFEGERSLTKNNHLLGRFELSGIPATPRGVPQIDVTFSVDEGGMLQVRAEDRASKSANDITVENATGRLSPADIQRMVDEAAELAEEDKVVRDNIDARNALESAAYSWKLQINDEDKLAGKLLPEEAHDIAAAVADADASKQKLDQFNAITHPIAAKYYSQHSGADEEDELW
ncbi:Heat shock 70 kDa protein C [Diplonema papillatum]|nr:Heat shock 70 kDa protein C [Diplonema papillatum]